jgi:hypothetical protein
VEPGTSSDDGAGDRADQNSARGFDASRFETEIIDSLKQELEKLKVSTVGPGTSSDDKAGDHADQNSARGFDASRFEAEIIYVTHAAREQDARWQLREQRLLRPLTTGESGCELTDAPEGTYFFTDHLQFAHHACLVDWLRLKVYRDTSSSAQMEVHKLTGGIELLIGFLGKGDKDHVLECVRTQETATILFCPRPSKVFLEGGISQEYLVSIPLTSVMSVKPFGVPGTDLTHLFLEVKPDL